MTLRGLGPYLHGARLEIKPLTILCGKNGSGKSTWIEMLRRMKWTVEQPGFPFAYLDNQTATAGGKSVHSRARSDLFAPLAMPVLLSRDLFQLTRQHMWPQARQKVLGLNDAQLKQQEIEFGPPGCIGFEITANRSIDVAEPECDGLPSLPQTAAERFIWCGTLEKDAHIRVRWTIFDVGDTELRAGDGLSWQIEICLNNDHIIRLTMPLDRVRLPRTLFDPNSVDKNGPHPLSETDIRFPWPAEGGYTLECSESFLFGNSSTVARVGKVFGSGDERGKVDTVEEAICNRVGEHVARTFCNNFLVVLRELLRNTLSGFFQIGAIRHIQEGENSAVVFGPRYEGDSTTETEFQDEIKRRELAFDDREIGPTGRYVGLTGKYTQRIYTDWAYNLMRQPVEPFTGKVQNAFTESDFPEEVSQWLPVFNRIRKRLVELSPKELQENVDELDERELAVRLLNSALPRRNLFSAIDARKPIGELLDLIGTSPKDQIERLLSLSDDEVIRVNRLLLESLLVKSSKRLCNHKTGYVLETFVSYWMKRLTQAQVKYGDFDEPLDESWCESDGSESEIVPNGGLVDEEPDWLPKGPSADTKTKVDYINDENFPNADLANSVRSSTIADWSPWHVMSTGFHQLAPIVVQAGLLHQHEIMAVENPEAHLHPSLQIGIAEFLVHQANAGKVMLIETHSDLFVRRILRAVKQEVIKQEAVRVTFTDLEDGPEGLNFKHAVIKQLQINDQGQIANWPPGFMDEDLKEAHHWIEAMHRDEEISDDE